MQRSTLLQRATVLSLGASLFASGLFAQTSIHISQNTTVKGNSPIAANTKVAGSPQVVALQDTFLMAGNTYAALSKDQGQTWSYYDPNQMFKSTKGIATDSMRLVKPAKYDMAIWVMAHNPTTSAGSNTVRIAVAKGVADLRQMNFKHFGLDSTLLGGTGGQWAKVQDVSTDDTWLYLSLTVVERGFYKRSSVVRMSLKDLWDSKSPRRQMKTSDTLKGGYYGFARGCTDTMYFASVGNTTTMRVFRWRYDTTISSATDRTIARWYSGFSISKLRNGKNWLGGDNRTIQTGYKLGNEVVFLFDSNKGGSFKHPFVRVSRFRTSNLTLVKEHNISSSNHAWAYPSVTVGSNNTVAVSAYIGGPFNYPTMRVGFVDGVNNWDWDKFQSQIARHGGNSTHSQKWGFRSNVVEHPSFPGSFLAAGQTMTSSGDQDINCDHRLVWFSRSNRKPTWASLQVSANVKASVILSVKGHSGMTGGTTDFVRKLWSNQRYVLTAPATVTSGTATWIFDRWTLNGQNKPAKARSLVVGTIGTTSDAAKAVYVRGYKLFTTTNNATKAPYTLSVADANGNTTGTTTSSHAFPIGTSVTVQFAPKVGGRNIRSVRSGDTPPLSYRSIKIKMDASKGVIAVYGYYTAYFTKRYGAACNGTNGRPQHRVSGRPEITQTFTHRVTNGVRNGNALAVAGLSKTNWNGTSLPYTFPGTSCKILAAPQFFLATGLDSLGNANLPIQIPNNKDLLGVRYYSQFAINDPATPLGFTTTEAYEVLIGGWDLR